jgi:hypothetical protein
MSNTDLAKQTKKDVSKIKENVPIFKRISNQLLFVHFFRPFIERGYEFWNTGNE